MTKTIFRYYILLLLAFIATSCNDKVQKKIVAVSQCSIDEWRDQMNQEILREAFFHSDLQVEINSTSDNTQEQINVIQSYIDRKVDLIVVAPNEAEPLRPVIEKAYDAGIPVILVDRKINSDKYSAFIGGDNVEVGRLAAKYIAETLNGKGRIIEIEGLEGSSSSQQRHTGFHEIIDTYKDIVIVSRFFADWQEKKAEAIMDSIGDSLGDVDLVFSYNDRMAIGAKNSAIKRNSPLASIPYVGVDALLDKHVGIGRIEDGTLNASFLYQTGGDRAIHIADCILNGKPYNRDNIFQTSIVNKSNVHIMNIHASHIDEQNRKIEFLNSKLDDFFKDYEAQRIVLVTFIIILILVCIVLFVSIQAYNAKNHLNNKLARQKQILEQQKNELSEQKEKLERQRDELEAERDKLIEAQDIEHEAEDNKDNSDSTEDATSIFIEKLNKVLDDNINNSELTVEIIGAEMGMSRVQLYRKTKAACGLSPNEALRARRLSKAYKMLRETNKTISEVAYEVGFSSPSYFAKCYKDYFGQNPTESLKK